MKFKEIKKLIYSDCDLIIGQVRMDYYKVNEDNTYDEYEVIGIRSCEKTFYNFVNVSKGNFDKSVVVVSLKENKEVKN